MVPYEIAIYLYLFRNSFLAGNGGQIRIGKKKIAAGCGKGVRGNKANHEQVTNVIKSLEQKGCIIIGDTTREGTLYNILLPKNIPYIAEKMIEQIMETEEDYFNNPEKRLVIFERDNWNCQYCGEKVTQENATLDHYVPQVKGGKHNKDNLKTSCLLCNSIKSGKTYEDAAIFLLKDIQQRRSRSK